MYLVAHFICGLYCYHNGQPGQTWFMLEHCSNENGKIFWVNNSGMMTQAGLNSRSMWLLLNGKWGFVVKKPNDPTRRTRVGRLLHCWTVDELFQFWNVLLGEVNLLSPRTEQIWMVVPYDDRHRKRLLVKPDILGPCRSTNSEIKKTVARLTLEQTNSHWKNIVILLRTIQSVIFEKAFTKQAVMHPAGL